jgi:hypothetical protein
VAKRERPQLLAHAVLADHLTSQVRGALDVVLRAGAHLAEDQHLGHVAPERRGDHVLELRLRPEVAVFGGQEASVAAHHAARDDRDLVDRIVVLQHAADERVPGLVVGRDRLLPVAHDATLALGAGDHPVDRLLQLRQTDRLLVAPGRQDGPLVHQVGEVGTGEARGLLGQHLQRNALLQRLATRVDLQDLAAAVDVGAIEHHLAVEAARP